MSTIINSISISGGKNVSINNGKVFIDGKNVTPDSKEINIQITGDVENLSVDICNKISVQGSVNNLKNSSGDIDINGNIGSIESTSGDIEISGNVSGNIKSTSGDIKCGNISGSVSTNSGDIKHNKI